MTAEVNMTECLSSKDSEKQVKPGSVISGRAKQTNGKSNRGNDCPDICRSVEKAEPVMGMSVLQGKVKALKKKQKNPTLSEFYRGEEPLEEALNVPQLRTYLTEDALNCSEPEMFPDAGVWGQYGFSGAENTLLPSEVISNECGKVNISGFAEVHIKNQYNAKMWPEEHLKVFSQDALCHPHSEEDCSFISSSMSLSERVERNRQELRWRFNKIPGNSGETCRYDVQTNRNGKMLRNATWMTPDCDTDIDSGVSVLDPEGCRDLSVRHEQAKQLLHRARMKAKGASPLRASHNVLPHAQLPPGSGLSALTDGGSLSDSSGSEYCSWHRGSRGSSPSHVRFQDESEHDVEERYRERQQQGPQSPSTSTNSAATQLSNGHKPWNQHLLSSGNSSQCENYGSYIKNSGASQDSEIVPQVTWNASLGSKITQGGSINTPLGVKSSPHWILPSQPWRVHTELIRETYIGGDSTADLSGEDELVRAQKKSCPLTGSHRSSKNKLPNVHSDRTIHLDPAQQTEGTKKILDFERDTEINKKHVLESRTKNISLLLTPDKLSGSNAEWETAAKGSLPNTIVNSEIKTHYPESKIHLNCVDPGLACVRQCATLQKDTAITLNSREGPDILIPPDKTQTELKKLSVSSEAVSLTMPVRVPTPPIGKAPMGQLRTARFTARPERTGQHLSKPDVHIGDLEQMTPKEKDIQSHDVPQTKHQSNEEMDLNRHLSFSQIKMKKEVTKRSDKSKDESEQPEVTCGQPERGKTHRPKRPRDPEKNYLFKDKCKPKIIHATRDQEEKFNTSRGQLVREKDNVKMEQKQGSSIDGKQKKDSLETAVSTCVREVNVPLHGTNTYNPAAKSLDEGAQEANEEETPNSPMKPTTKKGHIRSGMRRILSSFGLKSRPRLERFQSSSLDQIFPSTSQSSEVCGSADDESYNKISSTGRMTKCPSLQSLKLQMSQFPLPRKSSSVQNLLGKSEKSAGYVIGDANTAPRRALSVEDIGSPGMPRLLGRVAEVYPDGTRLLVIQRPPQSNFGFTISSVNGRPDSGKYVQDMSDPNTSKLYSGLLHVGDEILELNGTKVSTLGHDQLRSIMAEEFTLSLRVLHQRRTKC